MNAQITDQPIDPCAALARVGSADDGAAVLFLGNVRQTNEGRAVSGMHYDAYREMAERVLAEIVAEAISLVGDARVFAVHRIGDLQVGETSVAIAVSTPHRAEAFQAARHIIEEIKQRLPVWKQEHYVSGAAEWLRGHEAARHD